MWRSRWPKASWIAGDAKQALLGIVQKGVRAYEDHTGEPLDLSLIKAEEPV